MRFKIKDIVIISNPELNMISKDWYHPNKGSKHEVLGYEVSGGSTIIKLKISSGSLHPYEGCRSYAHTWVSEAALSKENKRNLPPWF